MSTAVQLLRALAGGAPDPSTREQAQEALRLLVHDAPDEVPSDTARAAVDAMIAFGVEGSDAARSQLLAHLSLLPSDPHEPPVEAGRIVRSPSRLVH